MYVVNRIVQGIHLPCRCYTENPGDGLVQCLLRAPLRSPAKGRHFILLRDRKNAGNV